MAADDWLLTARERGNPRWRMPAWCSGNAVTPLVNGATYFDRLVDEVGSLRAGDHLFFTDWRGDADQRLRTDGPTVGELFGAAARRGVIVKGLMWRSHSDELAYSEQENRRLGDEVDDAGGEVLLDQRIRRAGSHHQKLVVLRRPADPDRDVAFVGGIDLCHSRRDDAAHEGDPQALPMSPPYGAHPPWHDVQLEVHGPAVGMLDEVFRERWDDPQPLDLRTPIARLRDALRDAEQTAGPLPARPADPAPAGSAVVQVLRTYPAIRPGYPFAPDGERSVARGYTKALGRARRLVYLQDQYLWSPHIARLLAAALRRSPELHLVVIVPRHSDVDGRFSLPPNQVGRWEALRVCRAAASDRVHVFDLENHHGTPVYGHAKVAVVDDVWAAAGSANLNRRSWSHDSELTVAVLDDTLDGRDPTHPADHGDPARRFARALRLRLMREHLDRAGDDDVDDGDDLCDPMEAVLALDRAATALDAWHRAGRIGPRPPGRLRHHRPERLRWYTRLWAVPVYRLVYDPDGRTWGDRLRRRW
ncbi:phospholipase D family protein [Pseudonocardia sp. GCM10023141]|uniref:phospholipase D family protein n=1 Tax=Pseudonocardia sp. GCM10023141 TaxID=3252653 RepID=UPI00361BD0AC